MSGLLSGPRPTPAGRGRERSGGLGGETDRSAARRGGRPRPFDPARAAAYPALIGCDEVGRGALCGPVVVAAAWFDPRAVPPELIGALDDSKRLTPLERERLCGPILASARVALAARSAARVDADGVRRATLEAMRDAILRLDLDAPVRIDGRDTPPGVDGDVVAVVRGDALVPQIAAASIVAKVCRDRLMARLAVRHPAYRWDANAGYGTAAHLAALARLGPTRHHRRSFGGAGRDAASGRETALSPAAAPDDATGRAARAPGASGRGRPRPTSEGG